MSEKNFISPRALAENIENPNWSIVDGSWYLPAMNRNARAEFEKGHIRGASFFDIDEICDKSVSLPHMVAPPRAFADYAGARGISEKHTIVVYDGIGLFSAPRVWWNLRIMGARKVLILEGGLPAWTDAGFELTDEKTEPEKCTFTPDFDSEAIVSLNEMRDLVRSRGAQIADARPNGRFRGIEAEPRPGLAGGHMPFSVSLPASDMVENGALRPLGELAEMVKKSGLDGQKPIVTSCGSGVTAATINLVLDSLAMGMNRLYDGSWAQWGAPQWGAHKANPIETDLSGDQPN